MQRETTGRRDRTNAGALDFLVSVLALGWAAAAITIWAAGTIFTWRLVAVDAALVSAYWALDATAGGTVGKRIFGVRVLAADGRPASLGRRLRRAALKGLPLVAGHVAGALAVATASRAVPLPPLVMASSSTLAGTFFLAAAADSAFMVGASGRTLHDLLSGTSVVAGEER